ncbi:MAG TPA: manganese efflux pump [Solirubrobacteraceae bacterium]|nr:manganese efflux pump [Solirubrobacteraceae bacterium]
MIAKLVALVLPLSLDAFIVAAGIGVIGVTPRQRLRLSVLFCVFEAGMPLIGLALGAPLARVIGGAADDVAIGVLLAFGLYTLVRRDEREDEELARIATIRGAGALLLGVSVSLDELAVGFTLGLLGLPAKVVIPLIPLQALILTQLGLRLGGRLSERLRESGERIAGGLLTALALVLLAEQLLG